MMKNNFVRLAAALCCFVMLSSFAVLALRPVDNDNAVTFVIKNFGVNTKGEFKGLKGAIQWNEENPAASTINVTVNTSTVNTGIDSRDSHLKKDEYFDADKYPNLSFVSTSIVGNNGKYVTSGSLTIKGTTKTISFPFTTSKTANGYVFNGSFTINRRDYGVGKGSMVLSDDVDVTLKVQAVQ